MEARRKGSWHACRLILHKDSGRVRWCFGEENKWRSKTKLLALVPAFLLPIVIICIILTQLDRTTTESQTPEISSTYDKEIIENEEREVLHDFRTEFLTYPVSWVSSTGTVKRKRGIRLSAIPFERGRNVSIDWPDLYENDNYDNQYEDYDAIISKQMTFTSYEMSKPDFMTWDHLVHEESTGRVRKIQSETMKKYMDLSVDPCKDFYSFACGNWAKHNPIPPDRVGFDTFEQLRERLDIVLRSLLEEDVTGEEEIEVPNSFIVTSDYTRLRRSLEESLTIDVNIRENTTEAPFKRIDAILKAKYLYKSCMNEDMLNTRGEKPLLDLLKTLGGWPAIEPNWDENDFDFIGTLGILRLYNNDILLSEWVGPDIKNSREYVIQIDQTTLGLPSREYFLDPSNVRYVEAYRLYMIQIATLLGAPILRATADADEILAFETKLASIMSDPNFRRNVTEIYSKISIEELQKEIPQINWHRYISIVLERPVDVSMDIVVYCKQYLDNLVNLLASTPTRTVANYILWRFVRHRANNLDQRFDDAKQRFYNVILGREKSPSRWKGCIFQVNTNLGMALGSLFVKKYFDETSKNDTLVMTIELQQAFREILEETTWLDFDTKTIARNKIDAMRLRIGYPDLILEKDTLTDKMHDITIHPDYYFENILSILLHVTRAEQSKIGKNVDKDNWNTAPAIVNAYYSRNKNQIMFPAGILQPPFYHRSFPRALNYGGIGVVIGHEITHGFDDKGRLFDQQGNLQKWWTDTSVNHFHERTECLVNQYNKFTIPEINIKVDGLNTQGENIADNGGIRQAFRAYQRWQRAHPNEDESLPGLNMTNKQLFFLNFAQVWCGSIRPEAAKNKVKTAVHSPGRFRVIGTLTNSVSFSEVFQCPLGSPMNPKKKCSIW